MATSRLALINSLKSKFNLNAVDASDFYGYKDQGIWIRDDICKPETDYYGYANATMEENRFNSFLTSKGWYAEPYDGETIMLYQV